MPIPTEPIGSIPRPADLMAMPRAPQEMRYAELSRFIKSLERSGGDANVLRVERARQRRKQENGDDR